MQTNVQGSKADHQLPGRKVGEGIKWHEETLGGIIGMLTIMKAVMVLQMYTYFKTHQIVCIVYVKLIYINYISIKLLK